MWPTSLDVSMAAPKSKEGSSETPATLERPGQAAKVDAEHSLEVLPPRVVPPARGGEKLQKGTGTPVGTHHSVPHRATLGCPDREQRGSEGSCGLQGARTAPPALSTEQPRPGKPRQNSHCHECCSLIQRGWTNQGLTSSSSGSINSREGLEHLLQPSQGAPEGPLPTLGDVPNPGLEW